MADWNRRAVLKRGGALTAAGSILPSLAGCGILGHPLLAADSQPDGYPTVEALRFFARDLASRTDGRLNVQVYPSETLGSQNDSMELAQFGGVDFIRLNMAPLNVLVPETSVPALPFLFRSIQHMRTVMDGRIGREILDALAGYGLIGLAFYDSGARSIYTFDRPIHTPSDMRGLKIRVQTSDLFVAMIEAMGGNATPMAYGEVYQGLVQGVIDGAENNFPDAPRHGARGVRHVAAQLEQAVIHRPSACTRLGAGFRPGHAKIMGRSGGDFPQHSGQGRRADLCRYRPARLCRSHGAGVGSVRRQAATAPDGGGYSRIRSIRGK